MGVAALAIHGIRSEARLGGHAHQEIAQYAHGYLGTATLVVGVLAALAAAHFLARLVVPRRAAHGAGYVPPGALPLWRVAAIALLCISLGQELVESVVATGDPATLGDVVGHGGWTTVPVAIVFGGAVALAVHGSDTAIAFAARASRAPVRGVGSTEHHGALPNAHPRRSAPLADLAAGRAPPLASAAP
jgi:hypothetical protein